MSEKSERKINSKEIYKGKIISLYVDDVECPNGQIAKREYVKHPGGVRIRARVDNKDIMEAIVKVLLEKETLEESEVDEIMEETIAKRNEVSISEKAKIM